MTQRFIPDATKEAMNDRYAESAGALSNWRRLHIVRVLAAHGPRKSTELYSEFDSPSETTKGHIRILQKAGMIVPEDAWAHEPRWMLVPGPIADLTAALAAVVEGRDDAV